MDFDYFNVCADCYPTEFRQSYEGGLSIARSRRSILFEFKVDFKKDLAESCDQSNRDYNSFVNETELTLTYRGEPIEIPWEVKAIVCSFLGEAAIEHAKALPNLTPKEHRRRLYEWIRDNQAVIRDAVAREDLAGFNVPGLSGPAGIQFTRQIYHEALERFYDDA